MSARLSRKNTGALINMARIIYAINGDGMGHTFRSIPIITELRKRHEIKIIIGSHRCYNVISKIFPNVIEISGMRLVYKYNRVNKSMTFNENARSTLKEGLRNIKKVFNVFHRFKPEIVITDLESSAISFGSIFNIPVICVCNVHAITELKYKVPKKYYKEYILANLIIKTLYSNADYHIISCFFKLPPKRKKIFIFPPVLRKEILTAKTSVKDYLLVYQTSKTNVSLIKVLKKVKYKFILYGFDKEYKEGNLTFKKFSTKEFVDDLRNCRACIANGGHTFLTEALALHKPVLSIPIKGQFEQILNAIQIQRLGYGEFPEKTSSKIISNFIKNSDIYRKNLKDYKREDNKKLIAKLESIIRKELRVKG